MVMAKDASRTTEVDVIEMAELPAHDAARSVSARDPSKKDKRPKKALPTFRRLAESEVDGGAATATGLGGEQDFPDYEIKDLFAQTEAGGVQNKTLFYLTSSSLNVALMASNVADIARWVQKKDGENKQGPEILVLLSMMLIVQIGMLLCFCFKMYNSSALQTILDNTISPEERVQKEADVLKSMGFGNKLTVLLIALALITSVLQVAYKIITS